MFKVEKHVVEASELIVKYKKYFCMDGAGKDHIKIRKDFPLAELKENELRYLLIIFMSIH